MGAQHDDGGPAFPTTPNREPGFYAHHGMSLRDWFAGQAVAGLLASDGYEDSEEPAEDAYAVADSMLAARSASAALRDTAPDMLAALKDLVALVEAGGDPVAEPGRPTLGRALAAIARAEGCP